MNLNEFLQAANADDAVALSEAKAHTETRAKLISSNVMSSLLVQFELYDAFKVHEAEAVHAFMDRVLTTSEFNFYESSLEGAANFALFDALGLPAELRDTLTAYGSETTNPFANVTLYDVATARGRAGEFALTVSMGYVTVTAGACEIHRPAVMATNPRTGKPVQIGTLGQIGTAGKYDARIPAEYRATPVWLVDAYGVFS